MNGGDEGGKSRRSVGVGGEMGNRVDHEPASGRKGLRRTDADLGGVQDHALDKLFGFGVCGRKTGDVAGF